MEPAGIEATENNCEVSKDTSKSRADKAGHNAACLRKLAAGAIRYVAWRKRHYDLVTGLGVKVEAMTVFRLSSLHHAMDRERKAERDMVEAFKAMRLDP